MGGVGGVGRGVDSLAPPPGCDLFGYLPRMSPRFARLNTGLRTAATPPGCPARSASNWGSRLLALRCRFSLAADGNQRGELAMPICPVGAVRCSVAFP